MKKFKISLVGNPNVGKTTLYNKLTHSFEHVGNWHGITVAVASKSFLYNHCNIEMVDLPGLYSMSTISGEESVSRDELLKRDSDLIINVTDANNLIRNLYLTLQLIELKFPVVLAVNMIDELKITGRALNYRAIERALGIPVVPISAKYHSDVHLLMDIALEEAQKKQRSFIETEWLNGLPITQIAGLIGDKNQNEGESAEFYALKLLENDEFFEQELALSQDTLEKINQIRSKEDYQAIAAHNRFKYIERIMSGVITEAVSHEHQEMVLHEKHNLPIESLKGHNHDEIDFELPNAATEGGAARLIKLHERIDRRERLSKHGFVALDKIVLNKYLAIPVFLLIMLGIFWVTFGTIGLFFSDSLDYLLSDLIGGALKEGLDKIQAPSFLIGLLVDGIIGGAGGVLTFLPQIVLLFFFLAFMEDTGYLTRVAFVTDGIFRTIGLTGRSVFTMLMGFGCTASAVLTARNQDDKMTKIKTVLLTPFMSCGARMPVYMAIAAAYFTRGSIFIVFSLYLIGIAAAILWALIFERSKKFKSGKPSFIMEMPPYRLPTAQRVLQIIGNNITIFLKRVATVVFAATALVWFLGNFSITLSYVADGGGTSILQAIAGLISPIFAPLGFGTWEASAALLSGLVAKEVIISSLEALGAGALENLFVGNYPNASAFSFLVFTLLYTPCIAAISSMRKELGGKWTLAAVAMQLATAYVFALVAHFLFILAIKIDPVWVLSLVVFLAIGGYSTLVLVKLFTAKDKCAACAYSKSCTKKDCNEDLSGKENKENHNEDLNNKECRNEDLSGKEDKENHNEDLDNKECRNEDLSGKENKENRNEDLSGEKEDKGER